MGKVARSGRGISEAWRNYYKSNEGLCENVGSFCVIIGIVALMIVLMAL